MSVMKSQVLKFIDSSKTQNPNYPEKETSFFNKK